MIFAIAEYRCCRLLSFGDCLRRRHIGYHMPCFSVAIFMARRHVSATFAAYFHARYITRSPIFLLPPDVTTLRRRRP